MQGMVAYKEMWVEKRARTLAFFVLALLVAGLMGVVLGARSAHADTTFTVNSTGDSGDQTPGDGSCYTGNSVVFPIRPECTYRAAIQEANAFSGADTINFNIPASPSVISAQTDVKTITPSSALPQITQQLTIDGYSQPGASANTLAVGNNAVLLIELNGASAGLVGTSGVRINANNSTVEGLIINRWDNFGVRIGEDVTGSRLMGNFIGTDSTGTADLGNALGGVLIEGATNTTIGGTEARARNIISGNNSDGVRIYLREARENKVLGNYIGVQKDGFSPLGNTLSGVDITSASDNTIGGTEAGARNIISSNGGDGVPILDETDVAGFPTGNRILSNSIHSNGDLGIELSSPSGPNVNDDKDPDVGSNNLQNHPKITSARPTKKKKKRFTTITGTLNSTPNMIFTIQLFRNSAPDPSGFGEGQQLLRTLSVATDSSGNAPFGIRVGRSAAPVLSAITATATNNSTGDTSEFSAACFVGSTCPP